MPTAIYWLAEDWNAFWVREEGPGDTLAPVSTLTDWPGEDLKHVRRILQRLTSFRVENEADADDLVQETLLTMTIKCPAGGPDKGLLIWGLGILRRKIGNYYRRPRRNVPIDAAQVDRKGRLATSPERRLLQSELVGLIRRALMDMPDRQRRAMALCIAGLPASEVADAMRPERYQNVINHLFRGRRRIADQLAANGYALAVGPRRRKRSGRTARAAALTTASPDP